MEKILFEQEICDFLALPKIPAKEWDKKSAFKKSVAIVRTFSGCLAYAVASFDPEKDSEVRIVKTFSPEVFLGIEKVFIVPSYMDKDVENFDLDDESRKKAEELIKEAESIENKGEESLVPDIDVLPEWIFDEIHSKDEAVAWLKDYNKRNRIKGDVPKKDDTIKLRLYAIFTANFKPE